MARVLVVDDEPRNRVLVRAILDREYEILEAETAAQAYALLAAGGVDLVLLDVMMPGIDGLTACRHIKSGHHGPFLPVLLLTALADQEHRNRGFECGADDFISKPFDRRELQLRVRAFLRIRHQEELIHRQLLELKRLDQMKDDLVGLIVHDLRNPLAGLDGLLQLIRRGAQGADGEEIVDDALAAAHSLRDTIEDMLKVRMMEDSALELSRLPTSLHALATQATHALEGDAAARRLALSVEGDDIELAVDEKLLRRALENLIANGLRYTRPGSGVTVTVRRTDAAVELDVADRGPGIPEPIKLRLFEKYGSVEVKEGRPRRGNGLGLYLVRLAAEAHGGDVRALDRPGGGTIFRIHLPGLAAPPAVPVAGAPAA